MIWMTRTNTSNEVLHIGDFDQCLEHHYRVMKDIAESIYSPIAFLDTGHNLVVVYDVDTMTLDLDGTIYLVCFLI
jgi:hypothetical protein